MVVPKLVRGWFSTPGRPGDRTLDQQLGGLDWLMANCTGRSVLDVGCAEGLISIEMAKRGAVAVHGIEIIAEHVTVGNKLRGELPICFEVANANTWRPKRQYDIVVMLALLHKLKNPTEGCHYLAAAARQAVVMRLPPTYAPTIIDERSDYNPHHMDKVMLGLGFELETENYHGHKGEWVGVWVRKEQP
jgi:SAM-dependent methyltransferase